MQWESKWLTFQVMESTGKTFIYNVYNKEYGHCLGQVRWYAPWRQYCFMPKPNCVFEPTCLKDIASFISNLMVQRKAQKQEQLQK